MRHRKAGFKLQRSPSARRALLRGLATSVILQERVITTVTKAKAVKPVVEKMITLGKKRHPPFPPPSGLLPADPRSRQAAFRHPGAALFRARGRLYAYRPVGAPQGRRR